MWISTVLSFTVCLLVVFFCFDVGLLFFGGGGRGCCFHVYYTYFLLIGPGSNFIISLLAISWKILRKRMSSKSDITKSDITF